MSGSLGKGADGGENIADVEEGSARLLGVDGIRGEDHRGLQVPAEVTTEVGQEIEGYIRAGGIEYYQKLDDAVLLDLSERAYEDTAGLSQSEAPKLLEEIIRRQTKSTTSGKNLLEKHGKTYGE